MWINKLTNQFSNYEDEVNSSPDDWIKLPELVLPKCEYFKKLRNTLLRISDLAMLEDFPITESQRNDLLKMRQQLRDICDHVQEDHSTLFDAIDCSILESLKLLNRSLYS